MIHGVYAIWDASASCFSHPFIATRDEVAIRMFSNNCRQGDTNLSRYPEQFNLARLGSYDDSLGSFSDLDGGPLVIVTALKVVSEFRKEIKEVLA